ncbi:benzoate 1,2-dioxygenase small subunit [Pseudaquabacterium pictum]|uniref:Benzoate 1,2-dioxygenase small subunit n=1 Tax=Pseudaquabacterium pictum TaxID=2315236 RepID=A0A480AST5_9BURK|nr:benzoate 1,2-dioxygenase small subunit [Rubrivivax pictus]GCL62795.1 benzoate 1,2-dioxygenase small subunit [Rubrivivax pictus]
MMTIEQVQAFLYREARLLDDRQWDDWLALYHPAVDFWMPSWDDDDQLTTDPQREISLIYYANKGGLEDRVFRIKTERSAASMPEPRTGHNIHNVEIVSQHGEQIALRFNWHTLSYRYQTVDSYFGTSHYTLDLSSGAPLIRRKHVVLKNDYIHHVLDVYHI